MRPRASGPIAVLLVVAMVSPVAADGMAPARAVPFEAARFGFDAAPSATPPAPAMGSALAMPSALVDDGALLAQRGMGVRADDKKKQPKPEAKAGEQAAPPDTAVASPGKPGSVFTARRAQVMLQSLTVPGWGQASLGENRSALAFALVELATWGAFTAFKVQESMRERTYERTAALFGGIDLSGRDEEYKRVVSFYISSEEYNQLVVRRDATNLYFGDPAAYNAYIAAHEIKGADAWAWDSEASLLRYREERQNTQRAVKHAQDALAVAVINRLLSMIHASAGAVRKDSAAPSVKLECVPASDDPTAFHLGLRADF